MTKHDLTSLAGRVLYGLENSLLSRPKAAKAAGVNSTYIRDIVEGRIKEPSAEKLKRLAKVFGFSYLWFSTGAGQPFEGEQEQKASLEQAGLSLTRVVGKVQAGVWVEATERDHELEFEHEYVPVPTKNNGYKQFALKVQGESMNQVYPHGTTVIVAPVYEYGVDLKHGMRVVVERQQGSLVEATVKELRLHDDGSGSLWPLSDDPRYQEPVPLPDDDPAHPEYYGTEEVRITAIVTGLYKEEKY